MTPPGALAFAIGIVAAIAAYGFIKRSDPLNFEKHRWPVVVMNISWGVTCISIATTCLFGDGQGKVIAFLGYAGGAIGSLCWFWESLPTWGMESRPPPHTLRHHQLSDGGQDPAA